MKKEEFYEELVSSVKADFLARQNARKHYEAQWQLNNNFLLGNQYCSVNALSEVEDYDKQYFWQEREVFNHIAPLVEARLAKLRVVKPSMTVAPVSTSEDDLKTARISRDILSSLYQKLNLSEVINEVTLFSEITGTGFYKVVWDSTLGATIGKNKNGISVKEGEVRIEAVSPFEIFPENDANASLQSQVSIIHAKAYSVSAIKNIWGVDVEGQAVDIFTLQNTLNAGGLGYNATSTKVAGATKSNYAIVIERYEAPSIEFPNGRLVIVAEDKLLFIGELPFINLNDGKRGFPFVKQTSISTPSCFWGKSIIERVIPVQRAYNAVKNRKHEYLNRISMGVLTVEDGSVDTENLEEEGLSPGKILVYRQGSTKPEILSSQSVPADFTTEEERLLTEFTEISGVSDVMLNASNLNTNLSGKAIQLIMEQDDARLSTVVENIKDSVKQVAKQILKLYKQFAKTPRLQRINNGNGKSEIYYFTQNDITSDEIEFLTENKVGETLSQKRQTIFELINSGLLFNQQGELSQGTKNRLLNLLDLSVNDGAIDMQTLHKNRADDENIEMSNNQKPEVLGIDNHAIHIESHTAFLLSREFANYKTANLKEKIIKHINIHKEFLKMEENNEYQQK